MIINEMSKIHNQIPARDASRRQRGRIKKLPTARKGEKEGEI
jgi:hypothetical protein